MTKWHDTNHCNGCGFELTGLPRVDSQQVHCPECGLRSDPLAIRREGLRKVRRRDQRQIRVLMFLGVLVVALVAAAFIINLISAWIH